MPREPSAAVRGAARPWAWIAAAFALAASLLALASCRPLRDLRSSPVPWEVPARARFVAVADVEAGVRYRVQARGTWVDLVLVSDAAGAPARGLQKLVDASARVHPDAHWFELCGVVAPAAADVATLTREAGRQRIALGDAADAGGMIWTAPASGTLWLYANDLPGWYWNNACTLAVTLERLP